MGTIDRVFELGCMEGSVTFYGLDEQKTAIRYQAAFSLCDLDVDKSQLRLKRLQMKKSKRPELPSKALHDEILVLIGPDASPRKVVRRLSRLVQQIRKEGLYLGTTAEAFLFEDVKTGKITKDTSM